MSRLAPYFARSRMELLSSLQYRFNIITSIFLANVDIVAVLLFWVAAFAKRESLNGYSQPEMMSYLVIVRLTASFLLHDVSVDIGSEIKSGDLTAMLLSPRSHMPLFFFRKLGRIVPSIISSLGLMVVMRVVFHDFMAWPPSIADVISYLVCLSIGMLLSFFVGMIVGSLSFWMIESFAILWIVMVGINFFAGRWIPLDFFPTWAASIVEWSPFAAFGYLPSKIFLGHFDYIELVRRLGVQIAWCGIAALTSIRLWKAGVTRYEAVGM